ncbi:cupin domain-containing protein [Consotaella aegiceratis]|uniref:cupin domain-containing protein n=1 Tax=Consotaella aegiceratis TaxID=3097961 RepID=UPI002F406C22
MKASLSDVLARLLKPSPDSEPADGAEAFAHGSMSLRGCLPKAGHPQTLDQDAIYLVATGHCELMQADDTTALKAGDAVFVRAGAEHRFETTSEDFSAWLVLWGPAGGEAPALPPSVFAAIDA